MIKPTLSLPFPIIAAPPLCAARRGKYKLFKNQLPKAIAGYFSGLAPVSNRTNWVLADAEEKRVWMSVAPMERESQSHHVLAARGRVLVGGLGLGAILWALLQKAEVEEVVVVERSMEVVGIMGEVFEQQRAWAAHRGRFKVINADLFDFAYCDAESLLGRIDCALIDIWPGVGDSALRPDMQRIAKMFPAVGEFAAWGMELDFVSWLMEKKIPVMSVATEHWSAYSRDIGVPLIGIKQKWKWMSQLALQATVVQTVDAVVRGEVSLS